MAAPQTSADRSPLSAQVVGNAFVQQYYLILQQSPELVYRFYQETSKLGRPDAHGAMSSVTTIEAINQKILSMGFAGAELKTVDAQESFGGGVTVLVTGNLVGEDNVDRNFTQSFFLAPQDNGYYVLNDILRFVQEIDHQQVHQSLSNGTSEPHEPEHEQQQNAQDETAPLPVEDEDVDEEEVYSSDNGEVFEEEEPTGVVIDEVPNNPEPSVVSDEELMPKKSYASIVKIFKDSAPASVPTRASPKPTPTKAESQAIPSPPGAPASDMSMSSSSAAESNNVQEAEADGYSIYVKSLPLDATPAQLEEEFKKFGPIKPDGIQVRSHKLQGFCFGFVEFEVADAVQSAIQASPVMIGGRPVYVEEKRATVTRVNSRGRFAPGRGVGFRNDGRGRGNYGGGRGSSGRGDLNIRGGSSNRGSDLGYQRVDNMGSAGGRGNRTGSSAVSAPAKN
ncbi:ras GTPase-activating protein-binding protein 1-like isoform X1 [Canna indica]|uniref:Ras GTPase-activating protein-binding protein 1-like isoform X1 n=1 Tax=Canna indica TaxID=4628 RepID=A0AAQ3QBH7_9LILI|nr:ras GTPase-activating protein-binding protein 1-like isoform X1 [Canna indica]